MLIGEVSRRAGISARMLRHYDDIGLVSPTGRSAGGYREYSAADIRRLFHVESLRLLGMSLRDLRRALDVPDFTPSALVDDLIASTRERIAREEELLRRLRHVGASDPEQWSDVLRIVALMHGLDSADPSKRQQTVLSAIDDEVQPARMLAEAVLIEADPNVAGALRWALRRSSEGALEVLGPALHSTDPQTRQRAVAAVAELETAEASTALGEALGHPDSVVRDAAALALGRRGDVRATPVLITMVATGEHDVDAAEALGVIAREHDSVDQVAGTVVDELGRDGAELDARIRLAQALAELPGPVALQALQTLTGDREPRLAFTAAYLVKALTPPQR